MESDKMLFYLIIILVIILFIYVVYNLILKTCGCVKEYFLKKRKSFKEGFSKKDVDKPNGGNSNNGDNLTGKTKNKDNLTGKADDKNNKQNGGNSNNGKAGNKDNKQNEENKSKQNKRHKFRCNQHKLDKILYGKSPQKMKKLRKYVKSCPSLASANTCSLVNMEYCSTASYEGKKQCIHSHYCAPFCKSNHCPDNDTLYNYDDNNDDNNTNTIANDMRKEINNNNDRIKRLIIKNEELNRRIIKIKNDIKKTNSRTDKRRLKKLRLKFKNKKKDNEKLIKKYEINNEDLSIYLQDMYNKTIKNQMNIGEMEKPLFWRGQSDYAYDKALAKLDSNWERIADNGTRRYPIRGASYNEPRSFGYNDGLSQEDLSQEELDIYNKLQEEELGEILKERKKEMGISNTKEERALLRKYFKTRNDFPKSEEGQYKMYIKNMVDDNYKPTMENPEVVCYNDDYWLSRLRKMVKENDKTMENIRKIGQKYLMNMCSCMNYNTSCIVSLVEQEIIGKYFILFLESEENDNIVEIKRAKRKLSEITDTIIKNNKFHLFSRNRDKYSPSYYNLIWDLNL